MIIKKTLVTSGGYFAALQTLRSEVEPEAAVFTNIRHLNKVHLTTVGFFL